MRESIKTEMSRLFCDEILLPEIRQDYAHMFGELILLNKAYAVMLVHRGILDKESAGIIIGGLEDVEATLKPEDLKGELEEIYFNIERAMFAKVGSKVGGRLHCGRSRNDIHATAQRMGIRKTVWHIAEELLAVQKLLLQKAEENKDAVMTGYTHWQPGQPITFGHYCIAIFNALTRDFTRIRHAYENLNQSPYGAAAAFGSSFEINRQELQKLLGFDAVLENTLDCIAARDYIPELLSAYTTMSVNLSRMSEDMYFWASFENGILDMGGEIALCSSIMPQKKNPVCLEYSRAKASFNIGSLNSCLTALKAIPYTNTMEIFELSPVYFTALEQTHQQLLLISETLKYVTLRRERALKQAGENLCTVTSLADYWVKKYGISFTEAHDIVGNIVAIILSSGELISGITPQLVKVESEKALGWQIEMTPEELKSVLDPFENVQSKRGLGGPSIASVEAMIQRGKTQLKLQENWLLGVKKHVEDAYCKLQAEANTLK